MAKKATPVITQTEILSRAIASIKAEIEEWQEHAKRFRDERLAESYVEAGTKELRTKLDALKILYRMETGADYE